MYYNIHLHMSRFLRVFLIFHNWATKNITYNYVDTLAGDYFMERNNRFPKYKNSIFFFSDPRHRTELQACTKINIFFKTLSMTFRTLNSVVDGELSGLVRSRTGITFPNPEPEPDQTFLPRKTV
jgi:hypothetical protein